MVACVLIVIFASSLQFITIASAVLPDHNSPSFQNKSLTCNEVIVNYFYPGLAAPGIMLVLTPPKYNLSST